ncbi:MAG: hypothetical protein ABIP53_03465 [Candidatus Limnocylindrales bacterium]
MSVTRSVSLLAILLLSACASIPPSGTSSPGSPLTSASAPASSAAIATSTSSEVPSEAAATATPIELATDTPAVATRSPKPPRTPKPTPTRSPTTPPTPIDLEIFVYGADLPQPWYTGTTYTLPIHVTVTGTAVPNAHAKVTIENIIAEWETGPIDPADTYFYNLVLTLTAAGPTELTTNIKTPPGFTDTDRNNNKGSFPLEITELP